MKTNNEMFKQRAYSPPLIKRIKLDNEISLVLASDPPTYETNNMSTPEYFNNDPFKTNVG